MKDFHKCSKYITWIPCPCRRAASARMTSDGRASFTLVEVIVTIAIFTLAIGAVTQMILALYRSQRYTFEEATAVNEARKGIETMTREIRGAQTGQDGSYLIEKASDNEFIFYSDIDGDGIPERVRYFWGSQISGSQSKQCVTFIAGGACSVSFSNFLTGTLNTAQVTVSAEGDLGNSNEYADISADSANIGRICENGCSDCAGAWEGTTIYNVATTAQDNLLNMSADGSSNVNSSCNWVDPSHTMKAKFDLAWTETNTATATALKKGIIQAEGFPPKYPASKELITTLSDYVRNTTTPVFKYFDQSGNEITINPARPEQTTLMRVDLFIDVNPIFAPKLFELQSDVQLRNLKTNL